MERTCTVLFQNQICIITLGQNKIGAFYCLKINNDSVPNQIFHKKFRQFFVRKKLWKESSKKFICYILLIIAIQNLTYTCCARYSLVHLAFRGDYISTSNKIFVTSTSLTFQARRAQLGVKYMGLTSMRVLTFVTIKYSQTSKFTNTHSI